MQEQIVLDRAVEEQVKKTLSEYYQSTGFWQADELATGLLSLENYVGRFEYLKSTLPSAIFSGNSNIFISGTAAGSEMIIASNYNLKEVHGVEIEPMLIRICQQRLQNLTGMFPLLYDGKNLPYESNKFDLILSSHVIEHTESPFSYLKEHLRVLKYGGYFFIEFPTRYHRQELHTLLPSFEWLPDPLRNKILKGLSSRYSPIKDEIKFRYRTIVDTHLKQISLWHIKQWMSQAGSHPQLIHQYKVLPGIVRCLFKK